VEDRNGFYGSREKKGLYSERRLASAQAFSGVTGGRPGTKEKAWFEAPFEVASYGLPHYGRRFT